MTAFIVSKVLHRGGAKWYYKTYNTNIYRINHKRLPYDGYKKITLKIVTNHDLIMLSLTVKTVQRAVNNLQHGQQHKLNN